MENVIKNNTVTGFTDVFNLEDNYSNESLAILSEADSKYLRDLKMNIKSALKSDHLSEKEIALLGLALAANAQNQHLIRFFKGLSHEHEASGEEIAEMVACASLLSSNNILYRFRHFTGKEKYNQTPARMRMNVMLKPVTGKEFFEVASLAVSTVNGCEMCVNAHEKSLVDLGSSEERIFEAVRLASIVTSATKVIF